MWCVSKCMSVSLWVYDSECACDVWVHVCVWRVSKYVECMRVCVWCVWVWVNMLVWWVYGSVCESVWWVHVHMSVCVCICAFVCADMYAYICIKGSVWASVCENQWEFVRKSLRTWVCVGVCAPVCTCESMNKCVNVCVSLWESVCVYVCVHVYVCVCTHTCFPLFPLPSPKLLSQGEALKQGCFPRLPISISSIESVVTERESLLPSPPSVLPLLPAWSEWVMRLHKTVFFFFFRGPHLLVCQKLFFVNSGDIYKSLKFYFPVGWSCHFCLG